MHELAHALFCVFGGVKIYKMRLFSFSRRTRMAGYVQHAEPESFWQNFLITFGPFIVNSLATLFLFALIKPPYLVWQNTLFIWLGLVVGLQAIPSTGDAQSLFRTTNRRVLRNPLILLAYPFVFLIYLLNWLKRLNIDLVYVIFLFWLGNIALKGGI